MIEYLEVRRNERFKNSDFREFIFKPGLNIIVGANTSGKSSLLALIEQYNGYRKCYNGPKQNDFLNFQKYLDARAKGKVSKIIKYNPNEIFEAPDFNSMSCDIFTAISGHFSSRGESNYDYHTWFSENLKKTHKLNDEQIKELVDNKIEYDNNCIIIADEPDNNMALNMQFGLFKWFENLCILNKNVQIIVATHSLAAYTMINNPNVNIIEMNKGWINKILKECKKALQIK